jgi:hypothetical protein
MANFILFFPFFQIVLWIFLIFKNVFGKTKKN